MRPFIFLPGFGVSVKEYSLEFFDWFVLLEGRKTLFVLESVIGSILIKNAVSHKRLGTNLGTR